jgi:hypothetical protein
MLTNRMPRARKMEGKAASGPRSEGWQISEMKTPMMGCMVETATADTRRATSTCISQVHGFASRALMY